MNHTQLDELVVLSWKLADLGSDKFDKYSNLINPPSQPLYDSVYVLKTCERILIATLCPVSNFETKTCHEDFCSPKNFCFIRDNVDPYPDLRSDATLFTGSNAFRYLSIVASSLDSSTIGEPEILGQFKKALVSQQENKTVTGSLSELLTHAFKTGKKVHTSSDIPKGRISILSNAEQIYVDWIENLEFSSDKPVSIAIVGTGKMGRDAYKYFMNKFSADLKVYSRNRKEFTENTSNDFTFEPFERFELELQKNTFNVLILCSSTNDPFITPEVLKSANQMLIFDLGVPKNATPSLHDVNGITMYQMAELVKLSELNYSNRTKSLYQAYNIIDQQVIQVSKIFEKKMLNPYVKDLRLDLEKVAQKRLEGYTNNKDLPAEFYKWFNNTIKEMMHVSQQHLEKTITLNNEQEIESEESSFSSFQISSDLKSSSEHNNS